MNSATQIRGLDLARLVVMRRLAKGTAHAMNNALTSAMGETSFALDELRGDGNSKVTAEACEAAQLALHRCAGLCRSLSLADQDLDPPGACPAGSSDLILLVRDLERWLDEAIGGAQCLRVEAPDETAIVVGRSKDLQLLVMGLVAFAADRTIGTEVTLQVEPNAAHRHTELVLTAYAASMPAGSLNPLVDPTTATDALQASTLSAFRDLVIDLGGDWEPESLSSDRFRLTLRLPNDNDA